MSARGQRTLVALALQGAALAVLGLALLGTPWLDARSRPQVLGLVDRSHSVPQADSDRALAGIAQAVKADAGMTMQWIEFAGKPGAPSAQAAGTQSQLEPSATNIEAALDAALAAHAEVPLAGVVVVSDGLENAGDAARALRAAREAHLPVLWSAVGRAPPPARVALVLAPDHGQVGQRLRITVELAGKWDRPLRIKASARTTHGDTQTATRELAAAGRTTLEFDARHAGAVIVDVALEDPASGHILDALPDAAVIDIAPSASILYAQGSAGPLAHSLRQGGWDLNVIPARRLDAQADGLDGYRAVVLEDVAIADASPRFWHALVAAVQQRGLGLMVLAGERSFARGGYRESALESVLPVLSEPAALDQPASIVFAVDKSGSMGEGSGGVDRFRLAQRAVLETARGLSERDSLGLLVFDVAPRMLIPLGPAQAGMAALERPWPASPNGGTQLAPALEAAIVELEHSRGGRRMLVVVTDGFVDAAPLAGLRARLERARIETIALAVGPDADAGALEALVGAGAEAGMVLRVDQAAELPLVMRSGLERSRARVERGAIAVEQMQPLPLARPDLHDWPAIAAHAVTRSRPDASVAVQSRRGEPLIALRQSGRGRVVAVTSGLGPWTPQWLAWREWPHLAGGLAAWIGGTARGGVDALVVSDLPGGLQVEADVPHGSGAPDTGSLSIEVDAPTQQGRPLAVDQVAAGRWRALLPDAGPGLYSFLATTAAGTQRQLHLRRPRAETEAWGLNPALGAWRSAGLVSDWSPVLLQHQDADRGGRPVDRALIGLGLALFLSGVLVDRVPLNPAGLGAALRRRRTRG